MRNVLVLGSGAREHAIAKKIKESDKVAEVYVLPGNDGIDFLIGNGKWEMGSDFDEIYDFILQKEIDMVFVGSEQFLADGIVNYLSERSIKIVGPTKEAAQIESSKVFSKELMKKYNVPTAFYEVFDDIEKATKFIQDKEFPVVLKADGLAAGKGVLIANNKKEAEVFIREMLSGKKFGASGERIVIEEFLNGEEASIFAFCDGENFVSTIFSQDHKRAFDNDEGLNTGGMGAYAPIDKFAHLKEEVDRQVFTPVLDAMKKEGCLFVGVLFAGLMIYEDNINVVEFNCRFGDPETQVILPLLENDLMEICDAIVNKEINKINLKWRERYAVTVVMASIGYPENFEKGHEIFVGEELYSDNKLNLYFSGVKEDKARNCFVNSGGRVLSLTCLDETLEKTIDYVYRKIKLVKSDILRCRKDIGRKGLII